MLARSFPFSPVIFTIFSTFTCHFSFRLWRQSISIPISIPSPVFSSSSARPDRECIKKTWFPRDFHSNMCVWLTAKSIFALPPAADSPISILDSRLSIDRYLFALARCRLPLNILLHAAWSEYLGTNADDVSSRFVCTVSTIENNLQSARGSTALQLLTHFVRRPSICWVNTPIEIMELST